MKVFLWYLFVLYIISIFCKSITISLGDYPIIKEKSRGYDVLTLLEYIGVFVWICILLF